MSRIKLRYVDTYRDRHGRQRRYFRRPGYARIPLPGAPGSPEFNTAYEKAWAATEDPQSAHRREIGADRTAPRSVDALAVAFYKSRHFKDLSAATQSTYRGIIERFRIECGKDLVSALKPKHVKAIIAKKAENGTPHAANNLLRIIRLLMRYAIELEWRELDPTIGVRKIRARTEGFHTWSEEEIARFEARWPAGTRARRALALLLYTGQRRSDVIRMGRQHVRDGAIEVRQQKTGATLSIPIHASLAVELASAPKDQLTFLTTAQGQPFSPAGFTNWFRECCEDAHLPKGCSPHGLRKAAARRLAEAGATPHMIMAITGHTTLKEVTRYTVAAEQKRLARDAMAALGGTIIEHQFPNPASGLGKKRKNSNKINGIN